MKPKKISTHQIPVSNPARAFRFFHEVFDVPAFEETNEHKYLVLEQERLEFVTGEPTELELTVKDHFETLQNHLASYYVTILGTAEAPKNKMAITIQDFENNKIRIICNK